MPVARRGDPQTSWDAARSVTGINATQTRILAILLEFGPMTDERIAELHNSRWAGIARTPSGLRTRRSELAAMGLVVDTGRKALLVTGRASIVWRARDDTPPSTGGLFYDRLEEEPPVVEPVYLEPPESEGD